MALSRSSRLPKRRPATTQSLEEALSSAQASRYFSKPLDLRFTPTGELESVNLPAAELVEFLNAVEILVWFVRGEVDSLGDEALVPLDEVVARLQADGRLSD
jgi:hypothetical protein